MDQGSNENHSPVNNFVPTVTKFCVLWEGQALPHDTKFGNCRDKIVDSRAFLSWSLIHESSWSSLIKLGPGNTSVRLCLSTPSTVLQPQTALVFYLSLSKILPKREDFTYRQTPNISRTLVGNKMVDHSDVFGATPISAAPTTSSFLA